MFNEGRNVWFVTLLSKNRKDGLRLEFKNKEREFVGDYASDLAKNFQSIHKKLPFRSIRSILTINAASVYEKSSLIGSVFKWNDLRD